MKTRILIKLTNQDIDKILWYRKTLHRKLCVENLFGEKNNSYSEKLKNLSTYTSVHNAYNNLILRRRQIPKG